MRPAPGLALAAAADLTRTGDLWLFRGHSGADRAIQTLTNAPVNHVGMALVLDDLPPMIWHAELGRSLPDVWSGEHRRGAQLHDLVAAVEHWTHRYGQRAWLRQLTPDVSREAENAALRTVAQLSGTPFPTSTRVLARWFGGQVRRRRSADSRAELETAYCAEVVAVTYQAMGLLPADRAPNWFDPGRFWSGDDLPLIGGELSDEVAVRVPPAGR
jgi:hypothetical protein